MVIAWRDIAADLGPQDRAPVGWYGYRAESTGDTPAALEGRVPADSRVRATELIARVLLAQRAHRGVPLGTWRVWLRVGVRTIGSPVSIRLLEAGEWGLRAACWPGGVVYP